MPIAKLVSLGLLKDLPRAKATLRKVDGRRLACVRRVSGGVDVLDDRCPHEGHPLSMGLVRDGVLTCPWHNWKFDLATGDCLFGGESVSRLASEVVAEEVFVEVSEPDAARQARRVRDLLRALDTGQHEVALRESLRLADGGAAAAFRVLFAHAVRKSRFGCRDSTSTVAAAAYLVATDVLPLEQALIVVIAERSAKYVGAEPVPRDLGVPSSLNDRDAFLDALLEEQRLLARGFVERLPAQTAFAEIYDNWLAPFLTLKLWDRGSAYVRARHLRELVLAGMAANGDDEQRQHGAAESVAAMLTWAVAESDLPGWKPTRVALVDVARLVPGNDELMDRAGFVHALLDSERSAIDATLAALMAGVAPHAIRDVLASAALERLARYDASWTERDDSRVTVIEAARPAVFAAAMLDEVDAASLKPLVVMLAGLLGRTSRICGYAKMDDARVPDNLAELYAAVARSPALPEEPGGARLVAAAALSRIGHHVQARGVLTTAQLGSVVGRAAAAVLACQRSAPLERLARVAVRFLQTGLPPEGID
jgi:nitrite reductase/ring-hydroxylating ferredoxin subunit